MQLAQHDDILINLLELPHGRFGHILLNRPKALNALSLNMLRTLNDLLPAWQADDSIDGVIIEGAGDRAFCAGGDIRGVYSAREKILSGDQPYFDVEYHVNQLLFHFDKPYISILDGITMGGGLGVSVWGSHPIATDRLMLAMPETAIGLFPDIGASYFLTRMPDYIGWYLGLTGNAINAYEAYQLGLVKTVIAHDDVEKFKNNLKPRDITLPKPIDLNTHSEIFSHENDIKECFSLDSVSKIIAALEQRDAWCQEVANTLKTRSPQSLKITFEYLNHSVNLSFDDIIKLNLKIVKNILRDNEFFEGIRAAVIDKDKKPKWQHDISVVDDINASKFL